MADRSLSLRLRRQWSELQGDLLELILKKLDLADHARFASVCSSWRSVAVENPPISKPLYLALSHNPKHLLSRFITSFVPSWKVARFIGALDGWLVIFIDGRDLFLLNKGFNSIVPLPPPPKHRNNFYRITDFWKAVLSSSPSPSGECTVVLKINDDGDLFYCRLPSDKSFTKFLDTKEIIWDFVFYKGQLYVLCGTNTIIVFDHLLNKVTRMQLVTNLGDAIDDDDDDDDGSGFCFSFTRLLISENKLLIVGKSPFMVFEFEQSDSRVIPVNNLNDNLLLLTCFCSVSTTADISTEFRRNFDRISTNCHWNSPYCRGNWWHYCRFSVLGMPSETNNSDIGYPWPLFFSMFNLFRINNVVSNER